MQSFNARKEAQKARRPPTGFTRLTSEDVQDATRLSDILNRAFQRITELEARDAPLASEYELHMTGGTTYTIEHGFNGPIRWYVTRIQSDPNAIDGDSDGNIDTPKMVYEPLAKPPTATQLFLKTDTTCKCVVRVESSQYGADF